MIIWLRHMWYFTADVLFWLQLMMTGPQQRNPPYKQTYQWQCFFVSAHSDDTGQVETGTSQSSAAVGNVWHSLTAPLLWILFTVHHRNWRIDASVAMVWKKCCLKVEWKCVDESEVWGLDWFDRLHLRIYYLHRSWQLTLSLLWVVPPEQTSVRERWVSLCYWCKWLICSGIIATRQR